MDGNIEKMQSLTGRIKALAIDTTLTKKGMCAEAEAVGKALATKVSITDIVDDLTSVADDKPLSANQGRILKKQIDEIDPHYAENVLYNDTNVKDALDKVSNAENIAYDGEKSVQGAIDELSDNVEDVQTQIDTLEEFGYWTPNAKEAPKERNYYIKTKNMLHIFFGLIPSAEISSSNPSYNVCTDVLKTFGIKSFKDAFAYVYASNNAPIKVFASSAGNVIAFQYSGTEVSTAYAVYGQISIPINL